MENIGLPFAEDGAEYISDTQAHTGNYMAFKAQSDCVISAVTAANLSGNAISGCPVNAGDTVYLFFTSITLTSGKGFAYKAGTK